MHNIFVINPGSTSTKLAYFCGEELVSETVIQHSTAELSQFKRLWDQFEFRLKAIKDWIAPLRVSPSAVISMGGLLRPISGGTYKVNDKMLADARANLQGEHASNLGCALAVKISDAYRCPALVADPVSVDEFEPIAKYSGHPLIERRSLSHALNIHSVVRRAANELDVALENSSFIVAHLGGGISVAPVKEGKIIDANDASSDGPFSPNRTGGLPLQQFISLCYSGKYSEKDMRRLVMGNGGLKAYLGTQSAQEIEERIADGDETAREIFEAMAYQVAKEIGAMAPVLNGNIDAVILTGGLSYSKMLVDWIKQRVKYLGNIIIYPGEDEMKALASTALRILTGEENVKEY